MEVQLHGPVPDQHSPDTNPCLDRVRTIKDEREVCETDGS